MENRIITLDSLIAFCRANKTFSFSAKEIGHPLVVRTFEHLDYSSGSDEGLMKVKLKACHTGINRNQSFISDETMTRALPSFSNKPILAEIVKDSDGELDFGTHAMEIVEDEDGKTSIHYIEKPVGIVPESCNAHLEYDNKLKHNYVIADGFIFVYYGNEASDIIERRGGTDVSVEIEINEMSWDAKENYLKIEDFTFSAITLLGASVAPGMEGAKLEMSDFSQYQSIDYSKEINEMKSRLVVLESRFDNKNSKEGGNQTLSKLDELLAQYGKTVDDIDFEELEAKFAEVFGTDDNAPSSEGDNEDGQTKKEPDNGDSDDESTDETSTSDEFDDSSSNDDSTDDDPQGISNAQKTEDDEEGSGEKKPNNDFALSLQEKINALSNLVSATYEESDNEWYYTLVYDDFVIMCGYFSGRAYKQNYKCENDEYSLVGDRVEVYVQYLTKEEMDALENMKKEFAELSKFKADMDKMQLDSAKEELLNDERFAMIHDTDAYKNLTENVETYSVEDLEKELKLIVADDVLNNADFSKFNKQKGGRMFKIPSKSSNTLSSTYGGIFEEKK